MRNLTWQNCSGNVWCRLMDVKLDTVPNNSGVYVIWQGGNSPTVLYVGQGLIRDRIAAHRTNYDITKFKLFGPLCITWAYVDHSLLNGIELFLANAYGPTVGHIYPSAPPIEVNLPQ